MKCYLCKRKVLAGTGIIYQNRLIHRKCYFLRKAYKKKKAECEMRSNE